MMAKEVVAAVFDELRALLEPGESLVVALAYDDDLRLYADLIDRDGSRTVSLDRVIDVLANRMEGR